MRILIGSQMAMAFIAALTMLYQESVDAMLATLYGALIGIMITLLVRRSTDRALQKAVDNPSHGIVIMFSGFFLRYAVAILGLLVGFKVLHLLTVPMITGFILMILVQVFTSHLVKS